MKNILIIEDKTMHFEDMKNNIETKLKGHFTIFPDTKDNFEKNNELIYSLQKGDEELLILDQFKDISLYIVDISLIGSQDRSGIYIYKKILTKYPTSKIIIISNSKNPLPNGSLPNVIYISKTDHGRYNFPIELARRISELFDIELAGEVEKATNEPLEEKKEPGKPTGKEPLTDKLFFLVKSFGWKSIPHYAWLYINKSTARFVDKIILFVFYITLMATIVTGGASIFHDNYFIVKDIFHAYGTDKNLPVPKEQITPYEIEERTKATQNLHEMQILQTAEHIFLYLLKVCIVFGFFIYYNKNLRTYLLNGNPDKDENMISTKTMSFSKVIFISSLISYMLIKIIEEIYIERIPNLDILISSGALLLVLMAYFLILDKREKEEAAVMNEIEQ